MEFFKDLKLITNDTPAKETGRDTTPKLQCLSPPTATASATPIDCNLLLSIPNLVIIDEVVTR